MSLITRILLLTLLTVVAQHFIRLGYHMLGYGNTYITHYPGKCQNVQGFTTKGSEDMIILPSGKLIVTSGLVGFNGKFDYSKDIAKGEIYVMDTKNNTNSVSKLTVKGWPADSHFEPHGINYWEHKNKSVSLFVGVHTPERVVRFLYDGDKTLTVTKVYENSTLMINVNSVTATSEDSFYFSNIFQAPFGNSMRITIEFILHIPQSNVVHVNGDEYVVASSPYLMPNGLAHDGRYVYMNSRAGVHIFTKNSDHTLQLVKTINITIGNIDNLKLDSDGNLWIGCVRAMTQILAYEDSSETALVHGMVIRIRDPHGAAELESVFSDDSTLIRAISVAAYTNGQLFIGSINDKMVTCDVKYLRGG